MSTFFITTYGCQMNEHDSEIMAGMLEGNGHRQVEAAEEADIILVNTCCIREKAESKVLSYLGELKHLKKEKPNLIVGVCGCMAQQQDIIPTILKAAPHVNLIFGTHNMHRLPLFVDEILNFGGSIYEIEEEGHPDAAILPSSRKFPFKAFVNIIFGCNNFCTYCIVPHVRGRERSRPLDDIVQEVSQLVDDGVVEVTLLGQNVNSYGNDIADEATNFPSLLRAIANIEGLERIRFMTSHPKDFSDELLEVIATEEKICNHLHLPVQAGSNQVLKKMNRHYNKEQYLTLIEKIRDRIPDVSLTTDIIVGFPGETHEDFLETLDLVQKVGYDSAFSFVYSPRAGTPAATWEDGVSIEEKKARLAELNKAIAASSESHNQRYLGERVKVLVEGVSKNNEAMLQGRTDTFKNVIFKGSPDDVGRFLWVDITECKSWSLYGEPVENGGKH